MKTLILLIELFIVTVASYAQQTHNFREKFSLKELIDIADHSWDILEYGSKKINEKGYSLRRTVSDRELGTRLTFLSWASKVEIQKSIYIFENGPDFEIMYNIEFGDSTFNQVEIDHFNLILNEIKAARFYEIEQKKQFDGTVVQLFEHTEKNYSILLINSSTTKYLYIGSQSPLQYRFDNSLFKECCDPLVGCQ
jgi:hypothetical protein